MEETRESKYTITGVCPKCNQLIQLTVTVQAKLPEAKQEPEPEQTPEKAVEQASTAAEPETTKPKGKQKEGKPDGDKHGKGKSNSS